MEYDEHMQPEDDSAYLDGKMLIAMPHMSDARFQRTVVYICAHSAEGAMGLVLNRPATSISFADLLRQLDVVPADQEIVLPAAAQAIKVRRGGPVETGRGFVLHSSDYYRDSSTLQIDDGVSLTATLDILKAIVEDAGPARAILALGYAGWAPGQLEDEIQDGGWLVCDPDKDLIFGEDYEQKYTRALATLGVDPGMLVGASGNA
ncbi:MAG: YqgE/AlgH family protein [Rhodobiaceae bacterium]|nr:YqgE/AlgH family protein [Rhodobiaceae bacterium]